MYIIRDIFQLHFGAYKDGKFRSVGRNVLDRPLYNLSVAQFAELMPRSYSTPEFVSRSVLLIGSDYFATFDDVFNEAIPHRWSWFVGRYEEMPFIKVVRGGGRNPEAGRTDLATISTKGVWYDGLGDSMVIVGEPADICKVPGKDRVTCLALDFAILRAGLEDAEHIVLHPALVGTESFCKFGVISRFSLCLCARYNEYHCNAQKCDVDDSHKLPFASFGNFALKITR